MEINDKASASAAEIGEAVSQMDLTTQQNAALVEESAAASASLKHQARQLVDAVAVFKLADHAREARHVGEVAAAAPVGVLRPSFG